MPGHVQVLKWGIALFICHSKKFVFYFICVCQKWLLRMAECIHVRQTSTHGRVLFRCVIFGSGNVKKLRKTLVNL